MLRNAALASRIVTSMPTVLPCSDYDFTTDC